MCKKNLILRKSALSSEEIGKSPLDFVENCIVLMVSICNCLFQSPVRKGFSLLYSLAHLSWNSKDSSRELKA